MKNKIIITFFLFISCMCFSQEIKDSLIVKPGFARWRLEFGLGNSQGIKPYKEGYYATLNNKPFGHVSLNSYKIGAAYNFSKNIGIKADLSFDRFKNSDSKSLPFETAYFRSSIQLEINLSNYLGSENDSHKFNLLFHGGVNIGSLKTIKTPENQTIGSPDLIGGIVLGLTPMYKISKRSSIFFDFSSFNNYRQNHTWDGHVSEVSNNLAGQMINATVGITYSLGKNI